VIKPLKSVTRDKRDARPMITIPVAGHRSPVSGTKLYCLVTKAHVWLFVNNFPKDVTKRRNGQESSCDISCRKLRRGWLKSAIFHQYLSISQKQCKTEKQLK